MSIPSEPTPPSPPSSSSSPPDGPMPFERLTSAEKEEIERIFNAAPPPAVLHSPASPPPPVMPSPSRAATGPLEERVRALESSLEQLETGITDALKRHTLAFRDLERENAALYQSFVVVFMAVAGDDRTAAVGKLEKIRTQVGAPDAVIERMIEAYKRDANAPPPPGVSNVASRIIHETAAAAPTPDGARSAQYDPSETFGG